MDAQTMTLRWYPKFFMLHEQTKQATHLESAAICVTKTMCTGLLPPLPLSPKTSMFIFSHEGCLTLHGTRLLIYLS